MRYHSNKSYRAVLSCGTVFMLYKVALIFKFMFSMLYLEGCYNFKNYWMKPQFVTIEMNMVELKEYIHDKKLNRRFIGL